MGFETYGTAYMCDTTICETHSAKYAIIKHMLETQIGHLKGKNMVIHI